MYIGGIQRDFSKELNAHDEKERNLACKSFEDWIEPIFTGILKEYTETLFNGAINSQAREYAVYAINVLLGAENEFKGFASQLEEEVKFDKNELL